MRNFRILHSGNSRDIQYALALRDRVTETTVLEQVLLASVWRPVGSVELLPGRLHWTCSRSGHHMLVRASGSLARDIVAVSGALPEPLRQIQFTDIAKVGSYSITGNACRALTAMKAVDCNLTGHIRQVLLGLYPSQHLHQGIGWRFTPSHTPYFHGEVSEPAHFSFLPPPVTFLS